MKVIWKKTTTLGELIYMLNNCSCKKIEDYLVSGKRRFRLEFDCGKCEMKVMG